VLVRLGPDAELLAVVTEDDHRARPPLGDPAEIVDRRLRRLKRNRVPQRLAARKDRQHAAVVFREIVAVKLLLGQPRVLEMKIVEHRVLDAGLDQVGGQ
jgi:hypothetical protein